MDTSSLIELNHLRNQTNGPGLDFELSEKLKSHSLSSIASLSFATDIISRLMFGLRRKSNSVIQIQKQTWKFGETDLYANTIEAGPA